MIFSRSWMALGNLLLLGDVTAVRGLPRPGAMLVACGHFSPIQDREKIIQGLLAIGSIGCAGAQGLECAVDRLVNLVPLDCRPRLQARFGLVPGCLQILDTRLGAREIALVDESRRVGDDGPERREVAKFG